MSLPLEIIHFSLGIFSMLLPPVDSHLLLGVCVALEVLIFDLIIM